MNNDQINKTNMYQATNIVLTQPANQAFWSPLAAFGRGQASLAGSLNILASLAQAQGAPIKGLTADKNRLQKSVVNRVAIICGQVGPYAVETKNATLAAGFEFKQGVLENTRDAALDDLAQRVHDDAAALVAAQPAKLAEYGLTPAALADLQSAITAYSATLGTHTAARGGRAAITEAIAAEFTRADENLREFLDRLILQFQAEHPQFVGAYQTARKIIDLGGSSSDAPTKPAEPTK